MELGLGEVISGLKRELLEMHIRPDEKMLVLSGVELELKFVVEKAGEATGKNHYLFFAAEAKGSYKNQNVHTMRLKLEPNSEWEYGGVVAAHVTPSAPSY